MSACSNPECGYTFNRLKDHMIVRRRKLEDGRLEITWRCPECRREWVVYQYERKAMFSGWR